MRRVPMVDAVWAKQCHDLLVRAGRPAARILSQVGIDRARIETPGGRIPFARHAALLEAAAEDLADDLLGLRFGITRDVRDTGLIGYVVLNSSTYADAIRNFERCMRLFNEGYQIRMTIDGDTLALTVAPLDSCVYGSSQVQDFAIALTLTASRTITNRSLVPIEAEVYHAPPNDLAAAERLISAPLHYGCARLAVVAPRSWLELPVTHADNRLLQVLEGYCNDILKQRTDHDDPLSQLERWLVSRLPSGSFAAADAARELGMSRRTLARRLQEHRTNFAAFVTDVRRRLALRYLDDSSLTLSQIGYLLGYSNPSAFNHAFHRWIGRSPKAHRGIGL